MENVRNEQYTGTQVMTNPRVLHSEEAIAFTNNELLNLFKIPQEGYQFAPGDKMTWFLNSYEVNYINMANSSIWAEVEMIDNHGSNEFDVENHLLRTFSFGGASLIDNIRSHVGTKEIEFIEWYDIFVGTQLEGITPKHFYSQPTGYNATRFDYMYFNLLHRQSATIYSNKAWIQIPIISVLNAMDWIPIYQSGDAIKTQLQVNNTNRCFDCGHFAPGYQNQQPNTPSIASILGDNQSFRITNVFLYARGLKGLNGSTMPLQPQITYTTTVNSFQILTQGTTHEYVNIPCAKTSLRSVLGVFHDTSAFTGQTVYDASASQFLRSSLYNNIKEDRTGPEVTGYRLINGDKRLPSQDGLYKLPPSYPDENIGIMYHHYEEYFNRQHIVGDTWVPGTTMHDEQTHGLSRSCVCQYDVDANSAVVSDSIDMYEIGPIYANTVTHRYNNLSIYGGQALRAYTLEQAASVWTGGEIRKYTYVPGGKFMMPILTSPLPNYTKILQGMDTTTYTTAFEWWRTADVDYTADLVEALYGYNNITQNRLYLTLFLEHDVRFNMIGQQIEVSV